jgi:predicted GNAT family N-acyltransferase
LIEIRRVSLADTLPLRQRLLRPTQELDELVFSGDEDPGAVHLGAFDGDDIVGIASLAPSPGPLGRWRIRQIGVAPELRGAGLGRRLVETLLDEVEGPVHLSARSHLEDWYLGMGFERVGGVYDKPPVGPHVDMVRNGGAP